jgi:hypothetical protein
MDFGQIIQRAAGASLSSGRRSETHLVGVIEMVRPIAERPCRGNTLWLRDLLGKDRHLIPMRLDLAPIRGSAAHFLWINNG